MACDDEKPAVRAVKPEEILFLSFGVLACAKMGNLGCRATPSGFAFAPFPEPPARPRACLVNRKGLWYNE